MAARLQRLHVSTPSGDTTASRTQERRSSRPTRTARAVIRKGSTSSRSKSMRRRVANFGTGPVPGKPVWDPARRWHHVKMKSKDHTGYEHQRTEDRRFRVRDDMRSHSLTGHGEGSLRLVGTGHESDN